MSFLGVLACCLWACSAAPGAAGAADTAARRQITIAGVARSYLLHLPPGEARARPLVIAMHRVRGSPEQLQDDLAFDAVADREGLAVAYPEAIGGKWSDVRSSRRDDERYKRATAEIDFINALADALVAAGIADRKRVYLMGVSNGGFMTTTIACLSPERFAAFALVVATAAESFAETCRAERPLPLVFINGTADGIIAWHEERAQVFGYLGGRSFFEFWATLNGCTSAEQTALADRDPSDGSTISLIRATSCRPGGETLLYRVDGGGHAAPRLAREGAGPPDPPALGARNHDIETAEEVWKFLARFTL